LESNIFFDVYRFGKYDGISSAVCCGGSAFVGVARRIASPRSNQQYDDDWNRIDSVRLEYDRWYTRQQYRPWNQFVSSDQ